MATYYSAELTGIDSNPIVKPNAISGYNAHLKRFRATVTYNTQTTSDIIHVARFPAGTVFAFGIANTSVSTSTATIAVGITGTTGKYLAAAAMTTANQPILFVSETAADEALTPYTAEEQVFITIGTASLPASGTLVLDFFVSHP